MRVSGWGGAKAHAYWQAGLKALLLTHRKAVPGFRMGRATNSVVGMYSKGDLILGEEHLKLEQLDWDWIRTEIQRLCAIGTESSH